MEQAKEIKTITPTQLAAKLGIDAKRVRMILRKQFPRDTKNKSWTIPLDVAKKEENTYQAEQAKKKVDKRKN